MRPGGGSPSSVDLLISGKLYIDGELVEAAVGVEDGRVVWLGKPSLAPPARERVTAGDGVLVLPGMVDMHVHMRDLGQAEKEDWFTGTLSALAGGVTFVADMPNNVPPARSVEVLRAKEEAARKALVDYGFYIGLPEREGELKRAVEFGVVGLKLYPEDLLRPGMARLLREASDLGLLVVVHPEDPLLVDAAHALEERALPHHGRLRPALAEELAVRMVTYVAQRLGLRLHLTHLSSARALDAAAEAKARAWVTVDTAVHYLLLCEEDAARLGGIAKVNPPLRGRDDVEALRRALRSGLLDAIVTDHAPHRLEEKLSGDYDSIPPGFPGLELCLPLLMTMISRGLLPLRSLDLYSREPARILGIPKGRIGIGMDADFVFLNTRERWVVRGAHLRSKAKYTPFEGMEVVGRVERVYIRGVLAYDGEPAVAMGFGKRYRPGGAASGSSR